MANLGKNESQFWKVASHGIYPNFSTDVTTFLEIDQITWKKSYHLKVVLSLKIKKNTVNIIFMKNLNVNIKII